MSANGRIKKVLNGEERIAEVSQYEIAQYAVGTIESDKKYDVAIATKFNDRMEELYQESKLVGRKIMDKQELQEAVDQMASEFTKIIEGDTEDLTVSKVAEDTAEGDLANSHKMRCENCGKIYEEEYEFCPECGEKLSVMTEPSEPDHQDAEKGMKKCPQCGYKMPEGFVFCPECGTSLSGNKENEEAKQTVRTSPSPTYSSNTAPPVKEKKSNSKKVLAIIGAIIALIIIGVIVFVNMTATKPLILNGGEEIDIYVGDKKKIDVVGDGLNVEDYQAVIWTSDNEEVLTVKNGKIKASYDSDSFNAIVEDEYGEVENDICSCTTYVRARIERGMRSWEGSAKVNISLEPKKLKNGKIIKKPSGDLGSSLEVTAAKDYDAYIYLKSKNKASNDMSFTVKRGEVATVGVPLDEYDLYWAGGDTWYGSKFLFGPDTQYNRTDDDWDFTQYTWTFKMGVENGNLGNDPVDEDDFPEL